MANNPISNMEDELVLVELCTLKCNHVLCRNTIVPVDSSVSTHLKEMTYEWDTTFVKNFTILLYHLYGHPNHKARKFKIRPYGRSHLNLQWRGRKEKEALPLASKSGEILYSASITSLILSNSTC